MPTNKSTNLRYLLFKENWLGFFAKGNQLLKYGLIKKIGAIESLPIVYIRNATKNEPYEFG